MRFVLYFVFLIALQGGLSALIPQNLSGPNLFLLTAVALALRLHPVPSLLMALIGQWLTFLVLTYWLRDGLVTVSSLTGVLPLEAVLTFVAYARDPF